MNRTSIAWVRNPDGSQGFTWNPLVGCKAVSPGCLHCYAARLAGTRLAHLPQYAGLAHDGKWNNVVRFFPEKLAESLRHRKPAGIFVCDMADLYHESVTNEQIAAMYGVMAACPQHTFHVLTKRAKRRREWFEWVNRGGHPFGKLRIHAEEATRDEIVRIGRNGRSHWNDCHCVWPLPNVREGSTVCTQKEAERDIPELLQTPAACRFLSVEPMLEAITLTHPEVSAWPETAPTHPTANPKEWDDWKYWMARDRGIQWVIVGGESGPRARPFQVEWARSIRDQCKAAGVACFVKQMGANFVDSNGMLIPIRDRAGADPSEWPADLRVQEFPRGAVNQ
jgi:protein gp37